MRIATHIGFVPLPLPSSSSVINSPDERSLKNEFTTNQQIMSRRKNIGTAIPRLQQDYMNLNRDPVPYIRAEPLPSDMLEWHYVIQGPEDTPYVGGYYHGTLIFTQQYPFTPPSIYMSTPNGRFEVNRRLCLSISDYHPDEWNPSWCVSSILTGLLSFMLEQSQALGTIETSVRAKVQYARQSLAWNVQREQFRTLFPDVTEEIEEKLLRQQEAARAQQPQGAGAAAGDGDGRTAAAVEDVADGQLAAGGVHNKWGAAAAAAAAESDWASYANNVMLLVFTGLMGLVGYQVFSIMSAE